MAGNLDPSHLLKMGTGFWASKVLLSAVEFELFTTLHERGLTASELRSRLDLHERSAVDFFDTLVALGALSRTGDGPNATYENTPETAAFLDKKSPTYLGGILEMANLRLYGFWGHLTEALRTGKPQNEIKSMGTEELFEALYADPQRLEGFMRAMAGVQMGNFMALVEKFDFGKYGTLCDVGGASGFLCIQVAQRYPNVHCFSFDLPEVEPIAKRTVQAAGLANRIELLRGDFMKDPLPKADVITMGNILHDWDLTTKKMLLQKAYAALPTGGAFIAIENIIDDARRKNAFGLMMSLNMLIETTGGFDYTFAQFDEWCREAGFRSTETFPLAGAASAALAFK